MSMVMDLEAARARCAVLEKQLAELTGKGKPAVKAPVSATPQWDAFNKITDPAKRTAFWNQHEAELRAEQKAATKGAR